MSVRAKQQLVDRRKAHNTTINNSSSVTSASPQTGMQQQSKQHVHDPVVKQVCSQLGAGAKQETQQYAVGACLFGTLLFAAGAAPWMLPWLFVLFAVVCLPWRAYTFFQQKWAFYLIDFCYFVNVATVIYLLWYPGHTGLEALVYALSDGPLAGALVAWQCPWVFSSAEHTTSVLMHLLPGLALFAHRYHTPVGLRGLQGLAASAQQLLRGQQPHIGNVPPVQQPKQLVLWLLVGPLAFYITWQLLYFLVVQVVMRGFILRNGYETSYTCLARRAAKNNNIWNRLVRRGSVTRRICVYGGLQLCFTIICCLVFLPTYFSYWLAVAYQVVKVAFPVYYGARYQCQKVPQHVFLKGMQQLDTHKQQQKKQQQPHELDARQRADAQHMLCMSCRAPVLQSCATEAHRPQMAAARQSALVA